MRWMYFFVTSWLDIADLSRKPLLCGKTSIISYDRMQLQDTYIVVGYKIRKIPLSDVQLSALI